MRGGPRASSSRLGPARASQTICWSYSERKTSEAGGCMSHHHQGEGSKGSSTLMQVPEAARAASAHGGSSVPAKATRGGWRHAQRKSSALSQPGLGSGCATVARRSSEKGRIEDFFVIIFSPCSSEFLPVWIAAIRRAGTRMATLGQHPVCSWHRGAGTRQGRDGQSQAEPGRAVGHSLHPL